MKKAAITRWILIPALAWSTTGWSLHASDAKPTVDADGYTMVPVGKTNGKTDYIRVLQQPEPGKHLRKLDSDGKYKPENFNLSNTSPLASKSFLPADTDSSKEASAMESRQEKNFSTKSYFDNKTAVPTETALTNLDKKVPLSASNGFGSGASGFDKNFDGQDKDKHPYSSKETLYASNTSSFQNQSAVIPPQKDRGFASSLDGKAYQGPETKIVHKGMEEVNEGLMGLKDLPNRALTVDEVRALINHGVKPNFDNTPPSDSKPLNDPAYKTEPSPGFQDTTPEPPAQNIGGDISFPGAMAAHPTPPPENSEALPTK